MRAHTLAAVVMAAPMAASCATPASSSALGLSVGLIIGAGAGAAAGQGSHNETRGAAIGALVGAAIGSIAGYLAHREEAQRAKLSTSPPDYGPTPTLTKPVVRRVWVPDKVEGDKLVRGHFIYLLERPSSWTEPDEPR